MLEKMRKNMSGMYLFAIVMFVGVFFFAFERYCYTSVTTETPLFKFGDLPLYRMEFVTLFFSIAAVIGGVFGGLLNRRSARFPSLAVVFTALIGAAVAVLNVDTVQILIPTMRISHVAMTVSQVTAILLAASGVPVGIAAVMLGRDGASYKYALAGIGVALFLAVLAIGEGLYIGVFAAVSAVLAIIGVAGEFLTDKNKETLPAVRSPLHIRGMADAFISVLALVLTIFVAESIMTRTVGVSDTTYLTTIAASVTLFIIAKRVNLPKAAVYAVWLAALALNLTAVFYAHAAVAAIGIALTGFAMGIGAQQENVGGKRNRVAILAATVTAAVLAFLFARFLSDKIYFSNNRVVYAIKSELFALICILVGLKALLKDFLPAVIRSIHNRKR